MFSPSTTAWFEATFPAPTPVQRAGWAEIGAGRHALLLAPTGSGKTLAAFLWCLDRLQSLPVNAPPGVRVLYVSPLKALVVDVDLNLRTPLAGLQQAALDRGDPVRPIRVAVRTGDTSPHERAQQVRHPADILVTTPESLFLMLGSRARETLRTVKTVIVDEIHAVAGTKRGVHLALTLERLSRLTDIEPQRIGLSATQRPLEEIARFLGGDRPVAIVDASARPHLDLAVVVPVAEMEATTVEERQGSPIPSVWPAIVPAILELVRAHKSTIVFANSRLLVERLAKALNECAGEELVLTHHGSLARERRTAVEQRLKSGDVPAIVATSSLELGIDMGAVDLVIQVESPGSVARGLQRIGRAGHHVGGTSVGRMFPKFRGDLIECAVVAQEMLAGNIESTKVPRNALDVLAQQVVAICAVEEPTVDELWALVRRSTPYADLSRAALVAVLDMLSGRYPSEDFADLRPRIAWDRDTDRLRARKGAGTLALVNAGTIPDRGLYSVHLGASDGPRVGELDEEMVFETRPGQTIILGASTWRVESIGRDRVVVSPAPGEPGRMPFWHGDSPGRPIELGRALGAFLRDVQTHPDPATWLASTAGLDDLATKNLLAYIAEQRAATGELPTDRTIVVERFRDELGDWRVCVLSPFGARVHSPWALVLERVLSSDSRVAVQALASDDGIVLRFANVEEPPAVNLLFPDPEEVSDAVVEQLRHSALFATRFRECAGRALLLPRRQPGRRSPLWMQRLRAETLLAVAGRYPTFPIVLETFRECLSEVFDVPGLVALLTSVRRREIRVVDVLTPKASPFAKSLVFAWTANFLYAGDAPQAEKRAQALTLDRDLLRELLGQEELRSLLDAQAVDEVHAELQRVAIDWRAEDADRLHDLLVRLGDLSVDEIVARSAEDPSTWLVTLARERRAVEARVAGEVRWIAVQDVARYRDGLGVDVPAGIPPDLLGPTEGALEELILRYARSHGPFHAVDVASRFGLSVGVIEPLLRSFVDHGRLVHGEIRPGGSGREWCDPEVLRRLKRASLARLRGDVAPVDGAAFARFLGSWHNLGRGGGIARCKEVIWQLEGLALPWSEWTGSVLPARVADFSPRMLDELGAMGVVCWVGCGALGAGDGRVALLRRERLSLLEPVDSTRDGVHGVLLEHLRARGASFLVELQTAAGVPLETMVKALWELVWDGLVTNDTFAPLRELGARSKRGVARFAGGRWALVARPVVSDTERAHSRATMLLDRYGVVSREMAHAEELPGGFAAVYGVLRAMEESGKIRRGYFVDGLGGGQFAGSGAVDQLRASRDDRGRSTVILAAVDPANPYGSVLPWPGDARARRAAGANVVLVGGELALYIEKGGHRLIAFPALADALVDVVSALTARMSRDRKRSWRIDVVDGQPAATSPWADRLVQAGFIADGASLLLTRDR